MKNNKFDLLIFDWEGTLANVALSQRKISHIELFAGVKLGIKELKRQGFVLCIATGKGRRSLNQDLVDTNLKDYFLITKTVDECFSKPHPQMIEDILNFTMIEPSRALMIGDSSYDLEMANNAGISCLAIAYDIEHLEQLKKFDALGIIKNSYDLFDWLRLNG
jgi:phosphoglycolate phosphatase